MKTVNAFHTCKSMDELSKFVQQFNGTDGMVALIVYMVTINTINKLYEPVERDD